MFSINNLKVNADKFYDYLNDRLPEIEESLKRDQYSEFSNLSLDRDGSNISMTVDQRRISNNSIETVKVLEVDCQSFELSSSFFSKLDYKFEDHQIFNLLDLFEQNLVEDENVVFVVFGDLSTEMYCVEYHVRGIFTDVDLAFENVDDFFDSVTATKLNEVNHFYIGGYVE